MLKKFIFLFAIFLYGFSSVASEKPYIISGFDDVLRQAENTSFLKASKKIFQEDQTFSGMPELYQVISEKESHPKFTLVSAISNWFDGRINHFLLKAHYPSNHRYLRNWLTQWSIEEFKLEKIRTILNERPQRTFIVIFDNSEASLIMAEKMNYEFSKKILAVYLRQVVNKKIPVSAIGFYTAFDIAFNEYLEGRLNSEDVIKVGQAILMENNVEHIIPSYAACPISLKSCETQASRITELCLKVRDHLESLCTY